MPRAYPLLICRIAPFGLEILEFYSKPQATSRNTFHQWRKITNKRNTIPIKKRCSFVFAKSYGAVTFGVDGRIIDVEVDVSYGFPAFDIVGLLDTAVKESRERVRTAIKNTGVKLKPARVTINLAPADIRKDSSGLDLPIAVGLLAAHCR